MGAVVVPKRGRHMEKVKTPEYSSFHWHYNGPLAARVRVYVERYSSRVRQGKSDCGSDCPGESSLWNDSSSVNVPRPKLLDVIEGLNYLHTHFTIHGELKGAGDFST